MIARGEEGRVLRARLADRKGRHGDSAGHLDGGEQGVQPLQIAELSMGTPSTGKQGMGSGHPREVRRPPRHRR